MEEEKKKLLIQQSMLQQASGLVSATQPTCFANIRVQSYNEQLQKCNGQLERVSNTMKLLNEVEDCRRRCMNTFYTKAVVMKTYAGVKTLKNKTDISIDKCIEAMDNIRDMDKEAIDNVSDLLCNEIP